MIDNHEFKAITLSCVIHALVSLIIIGISNTIVPTSKRIVIDFGIEDSNSAGVRSQESNTRTQNTESRSQKSEVREQKPKIEKIEQKTETPISDTQMVSISENQVPVPAPVQKSEEVQIQGSKSVPHTTGVLSTTVTSGGGSAGSDEEGRTRYLKRHFSYIRDMIQRKITYPVIARQMGWEGKIVLSFIICADGYVREIKIVQSSGVRILDKNAIEAVKEALPFPKPPIEAQVIIPIVYRLN